MRLNLQVKTNLPVPFINTAIFKSKTQDEIVIDRHTTEYSAEALGNGLYRICMLWRECYVWDGENENILSDDDLSVCSLKFLRFELEDDVEIDNYFVDLEWLAWD